METRGEKRSDRVQMGNAVWLVFLLGNKYTGLRVRGKLRICKPLSFSQFLCASYGGRIS
jgi:hypothetical protein